MERRTRGNAGSVQRCSDAVDAVVWGGQGVDLMRQLRCPGISHRGWDLFEVVVDDSQNPPAPRTAPHLAGTARGFPVRPFVSMEIPCRSPGPDLGPWSSLAGCGSLLSTRDGRRHAENLGAFAGAFAVSGWLWW